MPVNEPSRVHGLLLDDDTAAFLAAALRQLITSLDAQHKRPVPRVFELARQLTYSATSSGNTTTQWSGTAALAVSTTNLLDTDTAATLLDCTAENVRALCRRGSLPAQRAGGRWLIPADAVHERAAHRKDTR